MAGQAGVALGAGLVEAGDGDVLAPGGVLGGDGVQRGHGRGVPDVGAGHVDDHVLGVTGVVELVDEVVGGGPEQLTDHGVDTGVLVGVGDLDHLGEVGDPVDEHHRRHDHAGEYAPGEVVGGDRDDDGGEHDGGLALRHPPQRAGPDGVPVEGADRDHDHHRDQGGHRDLPDDVPEAHHQDEEEQPGQEGGDPGAGARLLDVDHRLADHRATAHAAEEPRDDVGGALAPGLASLVGVGVGDVVDELGRHQRLHQPDQGHRDGER